jgi:2-oxo-4-hydroxy-4-carboxy-5-ureidoimidazoline decarboxylase
MVEGLTRINEVAHEDAARELQSCCGSTAWAGQMADERPFDTIDAVHEAADRIWATIGREGILEAFQHHPKIGDIDSLRNKFSSTRAWSESEQSSAATTNEETLRQLAERNRVYEEKFGYIFIVCATGKSAQEILAILNERIPHDPVEELEIAAGEQRKIMHIRLNKLLV